MEKKKKIPLNSLFLLLSYLPSPEKLVSTATRYKIVALKMHATTFNQPEWWIDLFPHHPPNKKKKKTRQNQYSLKHLGYLAPFSHSHTITLDKGSYTSLASERCWGDQSIRAEAIPSVGSLPCTPSGGSPCFELHLKWTVPDQVTTFLQPGANGARN